MPASQHKIGRSERIQPPVADVETRRAAMAVLAESSSAEIASRLAAIGGLPAYEEIRKPERGLVMVTGRIGGDGAPFNLGEATVVRAAVRLNSGELGFGYSLGRDGDKAKLMALCDALIQRADFKSRIDRLVIAPLRERQDSEREITARRTAATRVDFFTLVRGED